MKKIIVSLIFLSSTAFATSIDLQPGSSIRITASETTDIRCVGSSSSSECRLKNCTGYDSLFDVYAGEAKVGSCKSLSNATALLSDLRQKGLCR